jgi:hypothetical protein
MIKNKTVAAWLAFLGGPIGLHRFYLFGFSDWMGWVWSVPSAVGWYGVQRVQQFGVDDHWSWVLIPFLGVSIAASALNAIVYGLMDKERWNVRFNPKEPAQAAAGQTRWLTICAIVCALLIGTTSLMASLAFGFQRYFEYQIEQARDISQ